MSCYQSNVNLVVSLNKTTRSYIHDEGICSQVSETAALEERSLLANYILERNWLLGYITTLCNRTEVTEV
jgi:hypothetical protein